MHPFQRLGLDGIVLQGGMAPCLPAVLAATIALKIYADYLTSHNAGKAFFSSRNHQIFMPW
jgi:hypothetical protein